FTSRSWQKASCLRRNKFSATRELRERTATFKNLSKSTDRFETVAASPMSAEDRSRCMVTGLYRRTRLYRRLKINRNTAESIGVLLGNLIRSRTPFSVISLPRTEFLRSTANERERPLSCGCPDTEAVTQRS